MTAKLDEAGVELIEYAKAPGMAPTEGFCGWTMGGKTLLGIGLGLSCAFFKGMSVVLRDSESGA
jgi:hypothetical protein